MSELLDLLLRPELPDVARKLPTKRVEVTRLSAAVGRPVVFQLQGLPYGRVQELKRGTETDVHLLLAGCPELRDPQLQARFGAATPADAVKSLLLPGEIEELSVEVERLCGYRMRTIRDVGN